MLNLTFGGVFLELSKTDVSIIRVLQKNSRLSLRKIASKVSVSVATVMNRLNRLEADGIVKKYSVYLDYEKLGFDLEALIEIRVSKGRLIEVERKIASHPNVFAVYDITGDFDVVVLAKFRNRRALDVFVKKIQTYEFVERTETKIILNTIKEEQLKL